MKKEKPYTHGGYFHGLSSRSFFIRMYFDETPLASGTCLFCMTESGPVLVTNRHNFTGRNNFTGRPISPSCGIPNNAVIILQADNGPVIYHLDLFDHRSPDKPSWVEHPKLGKLADLAAVFLPEMKNIISENNSIDLRNDWHRWDIGSEVHVIGFPFGRVSGPFPIWSKGYIASEPDFDISNLPIFLIDCRSRPGQSGSPVFARFRKGDLIEHEGKEYQARAEMNYFIGTYSGRLRSDSDLGLVWKRSCVSELVEYAATNGIPHEMKRARKKFKVSTKGDFDLREAATATESDFF